jgi:hypothetical protein
MNKKQTKWLSLAATGLCILASCVFLPQNDEKGFTLAVIPDTQNYVDYRHQKAEGFVLDGSELFIQQMKYIAGRSAVTGGDIAFVASVGDVWQHYISHSDPAHKERGLYGLQKDPRVLPDKTLNIEIPKAVEGYQLISEAGIPFGVAPGNHDYDAIWPVTLPESNQTISHVGGLDAFRRVFGSNSSFFDGKEWYLDGHDGGSSSAQLFEAGGYKFLHFAFEMHPGDQVLDWAQSVIDLYPGLPTIISTHEFIGPQGERKAWSGVDLSLADPDYHNNPEEVWNKFIRKNDQIFLVLCGHRIGQALRVDMNDYGHRVYQVLADYQGRGQAGLDAGAQRTSSGGVTGLGDGWFRELMFYLGSESRTRIEVKTYSTFYKTYSGELDTYATWYRPMEQPEMNDSGFLRLEEFTMDLPDFYTRFGQPVY